MPAHTSQSSQRLASNGSPHPIDPTVRLVSKAKIKAIFDIFAREQPHPTTELIYHNPYQLLIAVVMSAQTTDKAVNLATARFFDRILSPADMVAWGEEALADAIRTIGLYRAKARHILALSRLLIAEHDGDIPKALPALMALPGVGLKTASVVMNTLFGAPLVAVDTHVFRVARRIGLSDGKNVTQVAEQLPQRIPSRYLRDAHHWLILHGRYVCQARKPQCASCLIASYCVRNEA